MRTATFHILTPYPSTGLYRRMETEGRLLHHDWDRYDTRHAVFRPARMTPDQLEEGYWRAYRDFYTWRNIARGASAHPDWTGRARHVAYSAGWRKFERVWDTVIRARRLAATLPLLEGTLSGLGRVRPRPAPPTPLPPPTGDGEWRPVDLGPRPVPEPAA